MSYGQGEIAQILALPRRRYRAKAKFTKRLRLHRGAPDLLPAQEVFLAACEDAARTWFDDENGGPGVLGLMSCGSGKTLALQLAPLAFGSKRPLILTEASLVAQLADDIKLWQEHYPCSARETLSYGKLSHRAYSNVLFELAPDLILADEGHNIGRETSARHKRLFRYLCANPACRLVVVTGTLMKRSLYDMASIAGLCLRGWSPLPFGTTLESWASVMDVGGEPSAHDRARVRSLVAWAPRQSRRATARTRARIALRHRLETCPGVVVTSGPLDVEVSLRLRLQEPKSYKALDELEGAWVLPDGTELVDSIEVYRHRRTLRLGFYYRYRPETCNADWFAARKRWMGVVRGSVAYGGFDSPYFVEQAAELGQLRSGALSVWQDWKKIRAKVSPPETESIWVAKHRAINLVLQFWDDQETGRIVWAESGALFDLFEQIEPEAVYRAGGRPPTDGRTALVSMAYSRGWNHENGSTLYDTALMLQPPTGADMMEQLLARHHRKHQTNDVDVTFYGTSLERYKMNQGATALSQITGNTQRFLLADWAR